MPSSVTVLMAVHNGERFLLSALESLRAQTWGQFEVLVIDDGSTDATAAILSSVSDARFSVHRNAENIGLTRSLNRGLALAKTDYLARLDADDFALPGRLAAQVACLDQHPEVGIVGSDFEVVDERDRTLSQQACPKTHTGIRWRHFFHNAFCHSSVMIRRSILEQHHLSYDERLLCAQDFDLWTRLLRHTRGANIGAPLVRWRTHAQSVTSLRPGEQESIANDVVEREIARLLGRAIDGELVRELRSWFFEIPACTTDRQWRTAMLVMEMFGALASCFDLDHDELDSIYADWLVRLSGRVPMARWPSWARRALLHRRALRHWPRIVYRGGRRLWHGLR